MITAFADFAALQAALTQAAERLAGARGESRSLEQIQPARRWRRASLLWPLFAKG